MTTPFSPSDRIEPGGAIGPQSPGIQQQPGTGFSSYMQGSQTQPQAALPQGLSPAQLAQGPAMAGGVPSPQTLAAQVSTSQDSFSNLRNQLNTKNLQLNHSQEYLLRNKLSDASDHLRAANSKLGITPSEMPASSANAGPIEKFLNYVGDGENQLTLAKKKISELAAKGDQMNPGDMLLVQVKFNQAQQEIEYSSTLLSKVISSLTQILNTQL